jgi:hypothetical protein
LSNPASTLQKRATSLKFFSVWATVAAKAPWPVRENTVYEYLKHLEDSSAPASRGQTFREALGFGLGFFGLDGVQDSVASSRVVGLAKKGLSRKEEVKQRDPLSVPMLNSLEEFVRNSDDAHEVAIGGTILFCVHARARAGDVLRACEEPVADISRDRLSGFVDLGLTHHKTMRLQTSKLKLPLAEPIQDF